MKKFVAGVLLFTMIIANIMPITAKAYTYGGVDYNDYEVEQLQSFLELTSADGEKKNGQQLNGSYNKDDPSTWPRVTWNSSGRVTAIDWGDRYLAGDLNLSGFSSLERVVIHYNKLKTLDVSNDTALTFLNCTSNELTSLNLSNATALAEMQCYYNKITALDVSSNTALTNLSCESNEFTTLDLSHNTALTNLSCGYSEFTTLDLSHNTELTYLYCESTKITTLDLSHNTKLTQLLCRNNNLSTLDLTSNPDINALFTEGNPLKQITANIYGADITVKAVGSGYVEMLKFVSGDGSLLAPYAIASPKDAAEFINWTEGSTEVGTSTRYDFTVGASCNLQANFTIAVQFDTDGGSEVPSQTVGIGDKVTKPSDPTKSGYVFEGWFKDAEHKNEWEFDKDTVSDDTTLYAKWVEELKLTANPADAITYKGKSITITPNVEGGTWEFDSEYFKRDGNTFTALKVGPTKIKYTYLSQSKEVDVAVSKYSIDFNSNGGSAVDSQKLDPEDTIAKPSDPTKDGNVFEGWFRESALTNAWDFDSGVSGDTTLYAKWVKLLELTLDPSDGIIYKGQDITITPNVEGGTWDFDFNYLSRDGNKFTALKAGETKVKYTYLSQSKEVDVTISKYSVDFNSDDGSAVESQKLDPDEKIVKPSDPTKEGYVFEGWFKESSLENAWDFDVDTVNEDTTLYAKWVEVLELTLDPSDGIIYKGQDITITPNVEGGTWEIDSDYLTRDGNTFTALKAGETKVKYTFLSQSKEVDVTISKYSVDFDTDDGSAVESQKLDPDEKIVKPSDPTKEGYVFEGWFKESSLENAWDFDVDTVNEDTTLYAKWVEVLELTLDPSDGIIYKGKSITITPNVEGGTWEFDTDYLSQDGNTFTALKVGTTKVKYTFLSQSKEVDVTISKYSIDFDVDGGSTVESQKLDPDEKVIKPSDPTKEGYVFEGWFKEAELTNAWDFDTDTVSGDTTLYAKWVKELEFSDPKKDIDVGGTTTIVPNVPGGTWEYDESYLKRDGNTFTALKSGTVRIKYTVGSQTICIYITITVKDNLPKTGEDFTLWFVIGAVLLLAGVGLGIHSHKKKA